MTTNSVIAVHDKPALREEADFLIFADLSQSGMSERWEQLWAHQLGDSEFRLCCIPFFTYGLALYDHVVTCPSNGKQHVIQSVASRSGHLVYRVWFGEADDIQGAGRRVEQYIRSEGWHFEWSSENLLAVDLASSDDEATFNAYLEREEGHNVLTESGV